ncbi:unnamed protein product, partial [Ectocarpus fasciculatus]
ELCADGPDDDDDDGNVSRGYCAVSYSAASCPTGTTWLYSGFCDGTCTATDCCESNGGCAAFPSTDCPTGTSWVSTGTCNDDCTETDCCSAGCSDYSCPDGWRYTGGYCGYGRFCYTTDCCA